MPLDIAVTRDAILEAEIDIKALFADIEREWNAPDDKLRLAMVVASMPEEAWALVDDDTREGIEEVLNA